MRVFIFIALGPLFKWSACTHPPIAVVFCQLNCTTPLESSKTNCTVSNAVRCGGDGNVCHGTVLTDHELMNIFSRTREKGCITYTYKYCVSVGIYVFETNIRLCLIFAFVQLALFNVPIALLHCNTVKTQWFFSIGYSLKLYRAYYPGNSTCLCLRICKTSLQATINIVPNYQTWIVFRIQYPEY